MLRSQKKEIKRDPAKYLTSLPRPLENHIWPRTSAFNGGKNDYPSRFIRAFIRPFSSFQQFFTQRETQFTPGGKHNDGAARGRLRLDRNYRPREIGIIKLCLKR